MANEGAELWGGGGAPSPTHFACLAVEWWPGAAGQQGPGGEVLGWSETNQVPCPLTMAKTRTISEKNPAGSQGQPRPEMDRGNPRSGVDPTVSGSRNPGGDQRSRGVGWAAEAERTWVRDYEYA
jgi:hypothetical protein